MGQPTEHGRGVAHPFTAPGRCRTSNCHLCTNDVARHGFQIVPPAACAHADMRVALPDELVVGHDPVGRGRRRHSLSHSTTTVPAEPGRRHQITTMRVLYAVGAERLPGHSTPLLVSAGRRVTPSHTAEEELRPLVADLRDIEGRTERCRSRGGPAKSPARRRPAPATATPIRPNSSESFRRRTLHPPDRTATYPAAGGNTPALVMWRPRRGREQARRRGRVQTSAFGRDERRDARPTRGVGLAECDPARTESFIGVHDLETGRAVAAVDEGQFDISCVAAITADVPEIPSRCGGFRGISPQSISLPNPASARRCGPQT